MIFGIFGFHGVQLKETLVRQPVTVSENGGIFAGFQEQPDQLPFLRVGELRYLSDNFRLAHKGRLSIPETLTRLPV
jgi:hypothetical protein